MVHPFNICIQEESLVLDAGFSDMAKIGIQNG